MGRSFLEEKVESITAVVCAYRRVWVSGLIAGLLAHMFALTNKLVNVEEPVSLMSKGATVTSGRWALELSKYLFPNFSMPWIYGFLSLVFICISACFLSHVFHIRSKILCCLLGAFCTTFPSVTGYLCYMFTAAPYCLGVLLVCAAVDSIIQSDWKRVVCGCVLLILATGIYQTCIIFAAALFVVHLIQKLLFDGEESILVLKRGICDGIVLVGALLLYYGIAKLACALSGVSLENADYAVAEGSFFRRFLAVYTSFAGIFLKGYYGFVRTDFSLILHIIGFLVFAVCAVRALISKVTWGRCLMTLLLAVLFPLSVQALYLVASPGVIHVLSQLPFLSFYLLLFVAVDGTRWEMDIISLCVALIIGMNIYAANGTYLKLYLHYEKAKSFYTALLANIYETPGYTSDMPVVFAYEPSADNFYAQDDSLEQIPNLTTPLIGSWTTDGFLHNYLGATINFQGIVQCPPEEVQNLPVYPDNGSIQIVDGVLYVRMGEGNG